MKFEKGDLVTYSQPNGTKYYAHVLEIDGDRLWVSWLNAEDMPSQLIDADRFELADE